ncbi:unnamed protein product, partial [Trichogramma brassicae]
MSGKPSIHELKKYDAQLITSIRVTTRFNAMERAISYDASRTKFGTVRRAECYFAPGYIPDLICAYRQVFRHCLSPQRSTGVSPLVGLRARASYLLEMGLRNHSLITVYPLNAARSRQDLMRWREQSATMRLVQNSVLLSPQRSTVTTRFNAMERAISYDASRTKFGTFSQCLTDLVGLLALLHEVRPSSSPNDVDWRMGIAMLRVYLRRLEASRLLSPPWPVYVVEATGCHQEDWDPEVSGVRCSVCDRRLFRQRLCYACKIFNKSSIVARESEKLTNMLNCLRCPRSNNSSSGSSEQRRFGTCGRMRARETESGAAADRQAQKRSGRSVRARHTTTREIFARQERARSFMSIEKRILFICLYSITIYFPKSRMFLYYDS